MNYVDPMGLSGVVTGPPPTCPIGYREVQNTSSGKETGVLECAPITMGSVAGVSGAASGGWSGGYGGGGGSGATSSGSGEDSIVDTDCDANGDFSIAVAWDLDLANNVDGETNMHHGTSQGFAFGIDSEKFISGLMSWSSVGFDPIGLAMRIGAPLGNSVTEVARLSSMRDEQAGGDVSTGFVVSFTNGPVSTFEGRSDVIDIAGTLFGVGYESARGKNGGHEASIFNFEISAGTPGFTIGTENTTLFPLMSICDDK